MFLIDSIYTFIHVSNRLIYVPWWFVNCTKVRKEDFPAKIKGGKLSNLVYQIEKGNTKSFFDPFPLAAT